MDTRSVIPVGKWHVGFANLGVDNIPHKCSHCQTVFSNKYDMLLHINTHKEIKPYFCNICKESFFRESDLNRHIKSHTGGKQYVCKFCTKMYASKREKQRHEATHTRKFYKCSECHKEFTHKVKLKFHFRKHIQN